MQSVSANIITSSNKIDFNFKFNKCRELGEIDSSLPTLIIGLNNAKKYIEDFNILKKHYPENNLWWTFLKTEKRTDYERDINNFNKIVLNNIIKDSEYELFDILTMTYEEKKTLWKYLLSDKKKYLYNDFNKFLFIYDIEEGKTYGLSLSTCRYCGCDTFKMMERIYSQPNNMKIEDFSIIPITIRRKLQRDLHKMMVLYDYFC